MADATAKLLDETFTEEGLRRLCRKAGILSIARKDDLSLNEQIRSVALLMLRNICSKAVVLLDYKTRSDSRRRHLNSRAKEVEHQNAQKHNSDPSDFGPGKVYKKHGSKPRTKFHKQEPAKRGSAAVLERDFEQKHNADCFY